jgi:hypothetical protein
MSQSKGALEIGFQSDMAHDRACRKGGIDKDQRGESGSRPIGDQFRSIVLFAH